MGRIARLTADVVNKIAAGEVVERPASVVKELVENALDAGARRVDLTVEEGGTRRIRVADDGVGMDAGDLAVCFESHTTSKLTGPEDLEAIATLGFRGEALASIGSVSRCTITSRARGAGSGATVTCDCGRLGEVRPAGCPEGTVVEVEALFAGVPARRKFLRRPATEMGHITESVTRLGLGHPELGISLRHGERSLLQLPPDQALAERIAALFAADLARDLLEVSAEGVGLRVAGFALPAAHARRSGSGVYCFVNGRFVRDRVVSHAVSDAYREMLAHGRQPVVFLHLEVDPRGVDVNVHPQKAEVRFRDSGAVHRLIAGAVGQALRGAGFVPRLEPDRQEGGAPPVRRDPEGPRSPAPWEGPALFPAATPGGSRPAAEASPAFVQDRGAGGSVLQVHDAFLVEETPEGLCIIDQHALHERILTEQIRSELAQGLPAQALLVPEVVPLSTTDVGRLLELADVLRRVGVEVRPFGPAEIAVHSVPALLTARPSGPGIRDLITDLLAAAEACLEGNGVDVERFLDRTVHTMACRAAVKAGDRLSPPQIRALLAQRDAMSVPPRTCPHGRPTTLRMSLEELRRRFERT